MCILYYIYIMKIISICTLLVTLVNSWDLSNYNISANYYISSIAIYRTRAFLALPRSVCHNNVSSPTVIEVPWTGDHIYTSPTIKNIRHKLLDHQKWDECKHLQDAVSLDIEPKKTKMWILDKGSELCSPKLVSYSLFYNYMFDSCELENIPRDNLNILVIDPEHGKFGCRAYIGNAGEDTILIFSLEDLKWWKLRLIHMTYPFASVEADFLSISKIDPILYITGRSTKELFSINLENIRNTKVPIEDIPMEDNVTFIGYKLGISTGLETDFKSGLSYFMVRDYVVLRWLIGSPLEAEYHNVLAQSFEKLPYVSELFTGPQNGLWALVNPVSPDECIEMNNTIPETIPKVESRVVKILKYNKFLDIF